MRSESDERMDRLKAAIHASRLGDLTALNGLDISSSELIAMAAIAKATDDLYMHKMALALYENMFNPKSAP